eukprot:m.386683 g.386683  ORF g.386683 m.386683 type:complete len:357 (+) comp21020_c1_seq1:101-1171(+)
MLGFGYIQDGISWIESHPITAAPFFLAGFLSMITYVVPIIIQNLILDNLNNDLKKRYDAKWALVTGASSGIGKAITEKLCSQGINVVLAALDDDILDATFKEISEKNSHLQFRKVGCDLSGNRGDYFAEITAATKDLDVQLVFNNAGYITVGKIHDLPLGRTMGNFECNAAAPIRLTQHYAKEMTDKKLKGLIAFTSSSAGFVPNPLSAMYASTKSFLTLFATSVAAEVRSAGIDVVVVHPSPMATNFFNDAGSLDVLMTFKKLAVGPSVIADVIFSSAGRFVVRDQGLVTILFRIILKFVDWNFFWYHHLLAAHCLVVVLQFMSIAVSGDVGGEKTTCRLCGGVARARYTIWVRD